MNFVSMVKDCGPKIMNVEKQSKNKLIELEESLYNVQHYSYITSTGYK